jgi:hypothetical protein
VIKRIFFDPDVRANDYAPTLLDLLDVPIFK